MTTQKEKELGIDLRRFKKYIKKNIGKKPCNEYEFNCLNCFAWNVYNTLESLVNHLEELDEWSKKRKE